MAQIVQHDVPFTIGARTFLPIATPGHAAGHVSYLVRNDRQSWLFVGDLLLCGGTVLLQHTHDCSIPELGASILRLADLPFDGLFPGHLHFCLRDGRRHVARAAERLRELLIPPSAV